jgi:hypothetical protein
MNNRGRSQSERRALLVVAALATASALSIASHPVRAAAAEESFTDPFAYCRAVGDLDAPDARYTGPKMPTAIAEGLQKAFNAPGSKRLEPFEENSVWRCMGGKVYACNIGANIPCNEKADTSRTPSKAMVDLCKANRSVDYIPAYVAGRATVYLWSCTDNQPVIVREFTKPDARGFLTNAWHEISPP